LYEIAYGSIMSVASFIFMSCSMFNSSYVSIVVCSLWYRYWILKMLLWLLCISLCLMSIVYYVIFVIQYLVVTLALCLLSRHCRILNVCSVIASCTSTCNNLIWIFVMYMSWRYHNLTSIVLYDVVWCLPMY
jgi:hypothetical protein